MKILVVSNLYPPHHIGGYELGCRDVVERLRKRGHTLSVLTSSFRHQGVQDPSDEIGVERILRSTTSPTDPPHDKWAEGATFSAAIRRFKPDVVYFWNLGGLSLWLPLVARWQGIPIAFFLSDTNFVSWRIAAWLAGAAKKNPMVRAVFGKTFLVQGRSIIQNQTCHFASGFLRGVAEKNGIRMAEDRSIVVHWGIELSQFAAAPRVRWPVRRLLYAGQMIPQKGVHTALAAFACLAKESGFETITFSLAGGGMNPDYENKLRAMPAQLGIADRVHFVGKVPRAELAKFYAEHDVLLFPSEWDEPFAITPLEAIHSGLAVVGTTTGGSGELFRNRETAMTYQAGDAADCARAIRELCADRALFETICRNAQREVSEKHTLDAMVDKIEQSLGKIQGN